MFKKESICKHCDTISKPKTITKGSFIIELFLWLFFIIPGVIYSLWRITSRYEACPTCLEPNMIRLDTPYGQKLMKKAS